MYCSKLSSSRYPNVHPHTIVRSVIEDTLKTTVLSDLGLYRQRFNQENIQYFNEMNFRNVHRAGDVVVPVDVGMGCQVFIREKDGNMTCLFMRSDSWGQYGPSEDYDVYTEFIDGCQMLEQNSFCQLPVPPVNDIEDNEEAINDREIECPMCRTINLRVKYLWHMV